MRYDSVSEIKSILDINNLAMQKKFGQNFLLSKSMRELIVSLAELERSDNVWEVGPGLGSITTLILDRVDKLKVFEIDRGFSNFLNREFGGNKNFNLIEGDFLKTFKDEVSKNGKPNKVLGNLPYCSASPIIASFVENNILLDKAVFTIQKEVALRMVAEPASKQYSSFTLLCNLDYDIKIESDIKKGCFYPVPDVTSSIVTLTCKKSKVDIDRQIFFMLIRDIMRTRRKTLKNNLSSGQLASKFGKDRVFSSLEKAKIDLSRRGETLSLDECISIVKKLEELN